ncbi:hypothetical protein BDB00DRAFT_870163 [Zychaea mexicana]|uniref:uncharacterized protein n=1 Tax=Zychaea mexicana TaxID=64656 RepID=UPI0022FF2106|nr:uncharacterized protein BDB00DRAFT_870163 [Zychaea mexicana]KAI9495612.1 hypothetical protein BDB00DRAFT_870163 [Zychaea mexicana]
MLRLVAKTLNLSGLIPQALSNEAPPPELRKTSIAMPHGLPRFCCQIKEKKNRSLDAQDVVQGIRDTPMNKLVHTIPSYDLGSGVLETPSVKDHLLITAKILD